MDPRAPRPRFASVLAAALSLATLHCSAVGPLPDALPAADVPDAAPPGSPSGPGPAGTAPAIELPPEGPPPPCSVDSAVCGLKQALYTCSDGRTYKRTCAAGCEDGYGCLACEPSARRCTDQGVEVCSADGRTAAVEPCDAAKGHVCVDGTCHTECGDAVGTTAGCEFFAVSTGHTAAVAARASFGVSARNVASGAVTLVVSGGALAEGAEVRASLATGASTTLELPWVTELAADEGSVQRARGAYLVRATGPVVLHQVSPVPTGAALTTGEGTLLWPTHALGRSYHAVTLPAFRGATGTERPAFLTVVATANDTAVTVRTPVDVLPLIATDTRGGTVTLQRGEVLQLATATTTTTARSYGADLSGAVVEASHGVLVLGANDCVAVPLSARCNHVEEVQLPDERLAESFVLAPFAGSGARARIVAPTGAVLTFDPAVPSAPSSLAAGAIAEISLAAATRLTASAPVAAYLVVEGTADRGPALSLVPSAGVFATVHQFPLARGAEESSVLTVSPVRGGVGVAGGYDVAEVNLCSNLDACRSAGAVSSSLPAGVVARARSGKAVYATLAGASL